VDRRNIKDQVFCSDLWEEMGKTCKGEIFKFGVLMEERVEIDLRVVISVQAGGGLFFEWFLRLDADFCKLSDF
jgi:hypothetical protein